MNSRRLGIWEWWTKECLDFCISSKLLRIKTFSNTLKNNKKYNLSSEHCYVSDRFYCYRLLTRNLQQPLNVFFRIVLSRNWKAVERQKTPSSWAGFPKRHFHFLEQCECVAVDGKFTCLRNFQLGAEPDSYNPGVSVEEVWRRIVLQFSSNRNRSQTSASTPRGPRLQTGNQTAYQQSEIQKLAQQFSLLKPATSPYSPSHTLLSLVETWPRGRESWDIWFELYVSEENDVFIIGNTNAKIPYFFLYPKTAMEINVSKTDGVITAQEDCQKDVRCRF